MSDNIYCAVDGCEYLAEIEVERQGNTLWLCGKHHGRFIPDIAELEAQLNRATEDHNSAEIRCAQLRKERTQLRAENERLMKALRDILLSHNMSDVSRSLSAYDLRAIARAILTRIDAEKEGNHDRLSRLR